jgi:hypothetical protein
MKRIAATLFFLLGILLLGLALYKLNGYAQTPTPGRPTPEPGPTWTPGPSPTPWPTPSPFPTSAWAGNPYSPTLDVFCTGAPYAPDCSVIVQTFDERPLVLELITHLSAFFYDRWREPETGAWGVSVAFTPAPCFLGRPWASFYLKDLAETPCYWEIGKGWICPPQNIYGTARFTNHCVGLPVLPIGDRQ